MRTLAPRAVWAAYGVLLLLVQVRPVDAERLPSTTYTIGDGLPHRVITRIVPDSRGFVWFCTRRGLSRFDGGRFYTYGVAEGLPIPSINDLIETSRGEYWVATNGAGVCRLNTSASGNAARGTSRFTDCARGETPDANRVNRLYEDRAGRLWAGTDGGLFRLVETNGQTKFERVDLGLPDSPDRAVQIWAFAEGPAGTLWMGTSAGLAKRLPDGVAIQYRVQPLRGADHVYALLVDGDDRIWIGHGTGLVVFRDDGAATRDAGTVRLLPLSFPATEGRAALPANPGEAVRFTTAHGLSGQTVLALHQSNGKEVWIGTSHGLSRFDGNRIVRLSANHAVQHVTAIAEDRGRHIWAGGEGGTVRLARTGFVRYTEADGLANDLIRSVFEDQAGDLYVVVRRPLIHRFDGTRFTCTAPNLSRDGRALDSAVPAIRDSTGEWWMPGEAGLYRFPRTGTVEDLSRISPKAIYTVHHGLAGDDIFRLFEDSRGDIWIARRAPTKAVLTRWDRATETFHRYHDSDGLPAFTRQTVFGADRTGSVWVGFWGGGVARHRNGRFTLFTPADGAPPGSVTAIYSDDAGRLWIATSGGGVAQVDDIDADRPRFIRYTTARGLASDYVNSITSDRSGRMYFGMYSRIDRLEPSTGLIRHYLLPDELAAVEVEVAYRDRGGTLWFGTHRGLASLIPGPENPGTPPSMFIGGVRVSGQPYAVAELGDPAVSELALKAHQNHLQIDFFSIGTESPVRYQYTLEGADRGWSDPTDQRSVTLASLSPGRYKFLVRAISPDGLTSAPASVALHIYPPLWLRWWFLTGAACLVALASYSLHRFRVGRLIELERVRMRIATDLHDDIGSSLTQIAILSEVAERRMKRPDPAVAEPISRVSRISRELVDSMSEIVWAINPRNDRLQGLAARMRRFAADMLTSRQIALRFRAPDDAPMEANLRRQVFLIFKEAVHNAVRHSGCTEVDVEIALVHRRLVLRVSDNGSGFDRRESTDGQGLQSMTARAREMGGRLDIVSNPAEGTAVRFEVPVARRAAGARKAS